MKKSNPAKPKNRPAGRTVKVCLLLLFGITFLVGAYIALTVLLEHRNAADTYGALREDARRAVAAEAPADETAAERTAEAVPGSADGTRGESEAAGGSFDASAAEAHGENRPQQADADPLPRVSMDLAALQELCPDIRAWLYAEGTSLDHPVVQTVDNEYYLSHLYNGERNPSGTLFIDHRNTGLFTEQNTVIYGHRMKDGSMFGFLLSYKHQDFYEEHPSMLLYTPRGDYLIELVCGTVEDGNREFVQFDFEDEEAFRSYIEPRRSRSTFQSSVEVGPNDKLISLCTCSYEQNNARYMLIGKLTPIPEDPVG